MKDKLIELLTNTPPTRLKAVGRMVGKTYTTASRVADHLLANGVIVLPCKVGDTVYLLDDLVWPSDCNECEHFDEGWYDCPNECRRTASARKFHECIKIVESVVTLKDILRYMQWDEFGKTVFLTREEAEKALAERSGQ